MQEPAGGREGFSVAVKAFQQAEIVAHQQGLVDDAEHKALEGAIADAARAGLELDNVVRAANGVRVPGPKAIAALDQAYTTLDNLFNAGVLHIKNPRARQELQALLLTAKGFLATISAVLR